MPLAVLNDKCFGNGSERGPGGDSACAPGEDTDEGLSGDEPDEDEEHEEEKRAKGKSVRKLPKDIRTIRIEHYPDDMTCCTCGCQMKSIKAEERVGMLRIVPEHVVQVKNVYHTCACNRGQRCKENGPVYTKAKGHIMKGRTLEAGLVVEAACQKFFESTATYRMERRMINNNVHLCRQTLGRNIIWLSEYLRPVRDALLDHVKRGSVAQMDETPLRIQPRGSGKSATGYLWAICRDERRWNPEAQPAVCYHYAPTRSGQVAEDLLSGSAIALLLTDDYVLWTTTGQEACRATVRTGGRGRAWQFYAETPRGLGLAGGRHMGIAISDIARPGMKAGRQLFYVIHGQVPPVEIFPNLMAIMKRGGRAESCHFRFPVFLLVQMHIVAAK